MKIIYDCPECGKEITIERNDLIDWNEGFEQNSKCSKCGDYVKISYMLESDCEEE